MPPKVENLCTDEGLEFFNTVFRNLVEKYGINHYHTYSQQKAAVVERWNGTLRRALWREFTARNTFNWFSSSSSNSSNDDNNNANRNSPSSSLLQEVVDKYNQNMKHRTIGMTPHEAWVRQEEVKRIHEKRWRKKGKNNKNNKNSTKRKRMVVDKARILKKGDLVRVSRQLNIFEKSYTGNWSEELFKISAVRSSYDPVVYELQDMLGEPVQGTFYRAELQVTKLPADFGRIEKVLERKTVPTSKGSRRKTMLKVRWKGYDSRFDSWINESDSTKL